MEQAVEAVPPEEASMTAVVVAGRHEDPPWVRLFRCSRMRLQPAGPIQFPSGWVSESLI